MTRVPRSVPFEENVSLASQTTLGVGGAARYLAHCQGGLAFGTVLRWARREDLPIFMLGGGSNLLVSDDGFDGVVVRIKDDGITFENDGDHVVVRAGAGVEWDRLVAETVAAGLGGIECLSGIPGCVGAAPIQNIGAYGQEVAETIDSVEVHGIEFGQHVATLTAAECGFGYRWSHFKGPWFGCYAVLGVRFRLRRSAQGTIRYSQLAKHLGIQEEEKAPLADLRRAVLEIRRSKSMVWNPKDPNHRSAGSFFINPVISKAKSEEVRKRLRIVHLPTFPVDETYVKLSAGWLIERSGFRKGDRRGNAGISTNHALAIINTGAASAAEIQALAEEIRHRVRATSGILLEPEPVYLGF